MSATVIPEIRERLEPWLADRIEEWQAQPPEGREATLPATRDRKVNVRGVAGPLA